MSPSFSILARARRWFARLHPVAARPARDRRRNLALREAIDMVVAGTDPRIRAVSGYGRKLKPAVERMLAYLDACGKWLQPPVEISARAWSTDPLLRMLFANAGDLREVFSASPELRAFFRDHPESPEAYVGLAATRRERRTLGSALHGEVLQRQVAQTIVHFTDHSVFGVCDSERELRAQVERRGFAFLVGEALERLVSEHSRRHGLEAGQHLLQLQLKALEYKQRAVDTLYDTRGTVDARIAALREQLHAGQHALDEARARLVTLDDYVASIGEVLSRPEQHLAEKRTSLRVNHMNVKVDAPDEPADQVVFSEIIIGTHAPRVVLLGRYPRSELLPERDRLDEAVQRLGG
ncbi:MAG: hypothetical protein MZV65_37985 [Chromatiales bacterium]|nr:hypothetical protein [Chromatiales bacterium]